MENKNIPSLTEDENVLLNVSRLLSEEDRQELCKYAEQLSGE